MESIRERLERDLKTATARLRHLDGTVAVEEMPSASGANLPFADEVDALQANESREIGFATRELLVSHVNRLSAALERVADGTYGVCGECSEPISPARLRALPDAQTCLRCQDRLERLGRLIGRGGMGSPFDDDTNNEESR
jgi:RNA polymerase-binding transcription factor DksA